MQRVALAQRASSLLVALGCEPPIDARLVEAVAAGEQSQLVAIFEEFQAQAALDRTRSNVALGSSALGT